VERTQSIPIASDIQGEKDGTKVTNMHPTCDKYTAYAIVNFRDNEQE
jgi:hypothetical protein